MRGITRTEGIAGNCTAALRIWPRLLWHFDEPYTHQIIRYGNYPPAFQSSADQTDGVNRNKR